MMTATDFDAVYRDNADPYGVESTWYERRKEEIVLAALTSRHYSLAWDAAAGTGSLARRLEERAKRVVATDASEVAVPRMADRGLETYVSALPRVPDTAEGADLILVSEVLYYLDEPARRETYAALRRALVTGGELVFVHWRHDADDFQLPGDAVTREIEAEFGAGVPSSAGDGSAPSSPGDTPSWEPLIQIDDQDFALRSYGRTAH